jgi:hypothetical protein
LQLDLSIPAAMKRKKKVFLTKKEKKFQPNKLDILYEME